MTAQTERAGAAVTAAGSKVVGFGGATISHTRKPLSNASRSDARATTRGRPEVRAIGPSGAFTVTGQTARALLELIDAGAAGRTALEVASWAYRFGAYVFTLRRVHGLDIETLREPHGEPGNWHARCVLHCPVRLTAPRSTDVGGGQ